MVPAGLAGSCILLKRGAAAVQSRLTELSGRVVITTASGREVTREISMTAQIRGFALLACLAISSAGPLLPQNEGIVWLESYDAAVRQAKQTHQPIFLEFRCEA
jgi:hypothetical protein